MWKIIDNLCYGFANLFENWIGTFFISRLQKKVIRKANKKSMNAEQLNSLAEVLPGTIKDNGKDGFYFGDCSYLDLLRLLYNLHHY